MYPGFFTWGNSLEDNHQCSITSFSIGLDILGDGHAGSTPLAHDDVSHWLLVLVVLPVDFDLSPLTMLLLSLNCQSVKYPGLEAAVPTSASPVSMATTRDMGGRNVGDACVHRSATPITRIASSSLYSASIGSTNSRCRSSSCSDQA